MPTSACAACVIGEGDALQLFVGGRSKQDSISFAMSLDAWV
jgi:hypothetical protein